MYDDFLKVISQLLEIFTFLIQVEKTKLRATLDNDINTLQACMKREQASSMSLKSLEKKRIQMQEDLGFSGLDFKSIVDKADDEYKYELNAKFDLLNIAMRDFKAISNEVGTAIEVNLANLSMLLSQRGVMDTPKSSLPNNNQEGSSSFTSIKA